MRAHRRAQSARPQGMSLANLLREAKGGACPEWHKDKPPRKNFYTDKQYHLNKSGKSEGRPEGARRPTAEDEPREFTS